MSPEAVNEGLRGVFHPRGEASTGDPTSGNSAGSPGVATEVMTTCWGRAEHQAVGLTASTVEDVARALQEHHENRRPYRKIILFFLSRRPLFPSGVVWVETSST